MLDWNSIHDKVDPNICIPCIPELTQGYVLQPTPDPFDKLRKIGGGGGGRGSDSVAALEAKEYLQQHAAYAELLTIVDRVFSVSPIQEQYKQLKTFVTGGANVDSLMKAKKPSHIHVVVISNTPSKTLYGTGGGEYAVWDGRKLTLMGTMAEVDTALIGLCDISHMKVEQLKTLGKLVGLPAAYKLKKAELLVELGKKALVP